jgi:ABC-type dipeptide/oligopeptide/nickel transport system ATPase component
MNAGRVIEKMSVDQLRRSDPSHDYTQQLLKASLGYGRAAVDTLELTIVLACAKAGSADDQDPIISCPP